MPGVHNQTYICAKDGFRVGTKDNNTEIIDKNGNWLGATGADKVHVLNYGAIPASDDDYFVDNTDMQNGAYTVKSPDALDPARPILLTQTDEDTRDTLGKIVVEGTNINDEVITEEIDVTDGTTVGDKAFKTVTSVTGKDWVMDSAEETADKIKVGFADPMGSPIALSEDDDALIYFEDTTVRAWSSVNSDDAVEENILTFDTNDPDGTRKFIIMLASQTA